ncbi:MAG: DUF2007 domain-containing protein [Anaerolineae bacterium]|nr:DUF2007 domain-containing protein [Anaerolineae bacterium]
MAAVVKGWRRWLWGLLAGGARKVEAVSMARFGGGERRSGPVVVFTGNIGEAQVVRSLLEAYDIPAMVQSESVAPVLGVVIGPLAEARVLVPEPLAEQARLLLESPISPKGLEDP